MRFIYSYKTPDGQRHEGEVESRTRDSAFTTLRERGIRPIRVTEKPLTARQRARRAAWLALAATGAAAVLLGAHAVWARTRYRQATREAFAALQAKAQEVRRRHAEAFAAVDFPLLRNYALIERTRDVGALLDEIAKGKRVIAGSRARMKDVFGNLYGIFPPESANERLDAQRLYGEIMGEIDASEERLDAEECALALLDNSRGKWRVRKGRIEFSDPILEEEFQFFRKDTDGSAVRWKKDFGQTGLESPIVRLPHPTTRGTP